MGIVQVNASVAWCKDATACMRALSGKNEDDTASIGDSTAEVSEGVVSSRRSVATEGAAEKRKGSADACS